MSLDVLLLQLSLPDLQDLAEARVPAAWAQPVEPDALPPHHVVNRSLQQVAAGQAPLWCLGFLVLRAADRHIVGACGFKHMPQDGRVEIGYGIAPAYRGHGAASAAVQQLLALAFAGGAGEVLAQVHPHNIASTRVVQRLGFVAQGSRVDDEGETLQQWVARPAALATAGDLPTLPATAPGHYRHYKGGDYEVLGCVRHSETLEPLVLYRALYGERGLWVRQHAMFFGPVTIDGVLQPRFAALV